MWSSFGAQVSMIDGVGDKWTTLIPSATHERPKEWNVLHISFLLVAATLFSIVHFFDNAK